MMLVLVGHEGRQCRDDRAVTGGGSAEAGDDLLVFDEEQERPDQAVDDQGHEGGASAAHR